MQLRSEFPWRRLIKPVVVLILAVILVITIPVPSEDPHVGQPALYPILGILGSTYGQLAEERAVGVGAITVAVGWNRAEPTNGIYSPHYLAYVQRVIAKVHAAGLRVILDPGLQYPPSWVFSLPGGTRFVDQYGDVFAGPPSSGNDTANGVTDVAVRSAERTYLAWLGSRFHRGTFMAVRQGGGPLGELRYPGPNYDGDSDCFWAYDSSTQASLPPSIRGWTPDSGAESQAADFLNKYNADLNSYGVWLNRQLHADFATHELIMLPGWGERPGTAASEVASLLTSDLPEFSEGLDWTDLLPELPDRFHSVAYTTYLDSPTYGLTPQSEDPASFIASLVAGTPIRLGGENTGDGTDLDLVRSMERASKFHYFLVQWQDETQLDDADLRLTSGRPTIQRLGAVASQILHPAA